jgi:hypothetical protein
MFLLTIMFVTIVTFITMRLLLRLRLDNIRPQRAKVAQSP